MKSLIFGDVHWCTYSSIVRKRGAKFSQRLENLINCMNWVEETAELYGCEAIIGCGDFFDKPELTAEELTALNEIGWANIPHYFIVGNHEAVTMDLSTSSTHLFNMIPNCTVFDKPETVVFKNDKVQYLMFPYCKDEEKLTIKDKVTTGDVVVISHNDVKGIQYGPVESKNGFDVNTIESDCRLFINGHLHNGSQFCRNGVNIGNLTGQNFGEDGSKYAHSVFIFDDETFQITTVLNPYAFNFYKLDITDADQAARVFAGLKDNSIITAKVPEEHVAAVKQLIESFPQIRENRIVTVIDKNKDDTTTSGAQLEAVNHLDQFIKYVKETYEQSDILLEELSEVCR